MRRALQCVGGPGLLLGVAVTLAACAPAEPPCAAGACGSVSDGGPSPDGPADLPTPGFDLCGNGRDDDGNGLVDDRCDCAVGAVQSCYLGPSVQAGIGACALGSQTCLGDFEFGTWGPCAGQGVPSSDLCGDSIDNDCDGDVDDTCGCALGAVEACYDGPPGTDGVGVCRGGSRTCETTPGGPGWGPCVGAIGPGTEVCGDGLDNDCDGVADTGCTCTLGDTRPCYPGPAGTDGLGACHAGQLVCEPNGAGGSRWSTCTGAVVPTGEVCGDGLDNDCNGRADCGDPACSAGCCTPSDDTFRIALEPADVLFLVDRSGSMAEPAGSMNRWQALKSAISAVLPAVDDVLYTGVYVFPTSYIELLTCDIPSEPAVGLGARHAASISSTLEGHYPLGATPTYNALVRARDYFDRTPSPRPRYVVLATDGEPTCFNSVSQVVSVIQDLRTTRGIDTFVLGIANADEYGLQAALNQMADAGGRARAGSTRYYPANSPDGFQRALRGIVAATSDCQYRLTTPPARPDLVTVSQDATPVARDGANGWDYTDASHAAIRFHGASCGRLTDGLVGEIRVHAGC